MSCKGCVAGHWMEFATETLRDPVVQFPDKVVGSELVRSFNAAVCILSSASSPSKVERQWLRPPASGALERPDLPEGDPEECYPTLLFYREAGLADATQLADVPPQFTRQWTRRGWAHLCTSYSAEHQLALPLHLNRKEHKAIVIGRPYTYSVDEIKIAMYIQRLLIVIDRQVQALSAWQRTTDAWPIATHEAGLTPREITVIALIAQGLTATAAARRLMISSRTVHKHLERAYSKLGVSDRVSAVRQATQLGLLSPEPPTRIR